MKKIKVYIDTISWFIRPKNTDWLYMKWISQMADYIPVEFIYEYNFLEISKESIHYISERFIPEKLNFYSKYKNPYIRHAHSKIINKGLADVIFSHSRFPIFNSEIPVVWFYGVVDPKMQISIGITEFEIEQQYSLQKIGFEKTSKVLLPTKAQMARHLIKFPEIIEKFTHAPFFLPNMKAVNSKDVFEKQKSNKIRILFVGREGKRKGLDILIKALSMLNKNEKNYFTLDVVCAMADGPILLNSGVYTKWYKSLARNDVLKLMRISNIFAMPSKFETYGFTLIEALAAGCVVIGPNWEAQNEILDFGKSGINVNPLSEEICNAMRTVLDKKIRCDLAMSGLDKFNREYSPEKVAKSHMAIFESAI